MLLWISLETIIVCRGTQALRDILLICMTSKIKHPCHVSGNAAHACNVPTKFRGSMHVFANLVSPLMLPVLEVRTRSIS